MRWGSGARIRCKDIIPKLDPTQKIRAIVLEPAMLFIGSLLLINRALSRILHRQSTGDNHHVTQALKLVAGKQHAADPRIDRLREKMKVTEVPAFTRDYLDPAKRSIANAVQVFFRNGTATRRVEVEYPLGHRRRRHEAEPVLLAKFRSAAKRWGKKTAAIEKFCLQEGKSPRISGLLDLLS
ncbi:MAG: hypothetical protein EBW47_02540 [Betaproteobacteria bacterium]|nr:hypothetical protein [Betaproteobacteria bacterium]